MEKLEEIAANIITDRATERPQWDEYFMYSAILASKRSSCLRRSVGSVAVKDLRVLATGYNGAPRNTASCLDIGYCERAKQNIPSGERSELCKGVHAEQNVIAQAALHSVSLNGASIYVTNHPCSTCAKMLINSGINEVVYLAGYNDLLAKDILSEAGVNMRNISVRPLLLDGHGYQ